MSLTDETRAIAIQLADKTRKAAIEFLNTDGLSVEKTEVLYGPAGIITVRYAKKTGDWLVVTIGEVSSVSAT